MTSQRRHRVLVLGAGIIGLSSALRIRESCPSADITIMAEKFSPYTCSDGAAGFWEVFVVGNTDPSLITPLSDETYDYMLGLALSPQAKASAIQQVSGYQLSHEEFKEELAFKDRVEGYRKVTDKELSRFPGAKDGRFFTSMTMDVTQHLRWLTDRIMANGCRFIQQKVHSFQELSNDWDVVVNCTGIGSYHLLQDNKMFPIRGQVYRVHAPWIKHFVIDITLDGYNKPPYYIFPNFDTVVVGGTCQTGNWNEEVDEKDSQTIWENATRVMPSLKEATILNQWVGLRPARETMRLEPEVMEFGADRKQLRVVHNYGHGGGGISVHWGCARRTVEMVADYIRDIEAEDLNRNPSSKL